MTTYFTLARCGIALFIFVEIPSKMLKKIFKLEFTFKSFILNTLLLNFLLLIIKIINVKKYYINNKIAVMNINTLAALWVNFLKLTEL